MSKLKQQERVTRWMREFFVHLKALAESRNDPGGFPDRCYRFRLEQVEPMLSLLAMDSAAAEAARALQRLGSALDDLGHASAAGRDGRRRLREAWRQAYLLRHELTADADARGAIGIRLHDAPWRVFLDESDEIVFDAGAGHTVALRGEITNIAWPAVIAQVAEGVPPYEEPVRPYDLSGRPGGLIQVTDARRLIVVGDLHGSYRNLETILKDKENLRALKRDNAHLLFLGDAVHPRHSKGDPRRAQEDSFRVMFLILSLKAEIPDKVHYLIGNHENAHLGGLGAAKATESEHHAFQAYIQEQYGEGVLAAFLRFLDESPVAAKFAAADGRSVLFVHGGMSSQVTSVDDLIDILTEGRRGVALNEVVWNREFRPAGINAFLTAARAELLVVGHTRPTLSSASKYGYTVMADRAFGRVGGKMMLLCSQERRFGYLDVDLTMPLPNQVDQFVAPDGKGGLRVLVPRGE